MAGIVRWINNAATCLESWLSLGSWLVGAGLLTWLGRHWSLLSDQGMAAIVMVALIGSAIVLAALALIAIALRLWRSSSNTISASKARPADLNLVEVTGQHFKGQTVLIDNHHYINCQVTDCALQYNGGPFKLTNFTRHGPQKFLSVNQEIGRSLIVVEAAGLMNDKATKMIAEIPKDSMPR